MYNVLLIRDQKILELSKLLQIARTLDFHAFMLDEHQLDLSSLSWRELEEFNQQISCFDLKCPVYSMNYKEEQIAYYQKILEKLLFLNINYLFLADCSISQLKEHNISELIKLAADFKITVLVENKNLPDEFDLIQHFFQTTCLDNIKLLFNAFNFLADGLMPLHEAYFPSNFKNKIDGFMLIDGLNPERKRESKIIETEIGQGNAQIIELVSANKARSFGGMLIYPVFISEYEKNKQVALSKMNEIRTLVGKL